MFTEVLLCNMFLHIDGSTIAQAIKESVKRPQDLTLNFWKKCLTAISIDIIIIYIISIIMLLTMLIAI